MDCAYYVIMPLVCVKINKHINAGHSICKHYIDREEALKKYNIKR